MLAPTTRPVLAPRIADEQAYVRELISRIVRRCPRRRSAGRDEMRAQRVLAKELSALGLETRLLPFRFNTSLYAVLALHFGLATTACGLFFASPLLAMTLHLFVAVSYGLDSTYAAFWLRRLLPFRDAKNLVATLPANKPPRLRVVLVAHADAAPTGWLFNPRLIQGATNNPLPRPFRILRKQMVGALIAFVLLAMLDLAAVFTSQLVMTTLFVGLTAACAIPLALNLQVWLRDRIVPGASDNLTGCAALPVLAGRLAGNKPDDVELVFVATGCEEAGCGGSLALARGMKHEWQKDKTVIVGVDILTNGRLRYKQCGEVVPLEVPPWLFDTVQQVAAADPRFGELPGFEAPAGSDDVAPFLAHGYDGVCLCCIDPELGVSRHYHLPSDTPENVEYDGLIDSIDFTEQLVTAIIRRSDRDNETARLEHHGSPLLREPVTRFPAALTGWKARIMLGMAAGAYWGGMLYFTDWWPSFWTFRAAWLALILLLPVFLLLRRFHVDTDRSPAAQTVVFAVLAAVGVTLLGLFIHPVLQHFALGWQSLPLTHGLLGGAATGLLAGGAGMARRGQLSHATRPLSPLRG